MEPTDKILEVVRKLAKCGTNFSPYTRIYQLESKIENTKPFTYCLASK